VNLLKGKNENEIGKFVVQRRIAAAAIRTEVHRVDEHRDLKMAN
jgi:hypothetical protein